MKVLVHATLDEGLLRRKINDFRLLHGRLWALLAVGIHMVLHVRAENALMTWAGESHKSTLMGSDGLV
jgi:hypothetical protein